LFESIGSLLTKPPESDNLPDPDVLVQEIVEDLEAALETISSRLMKFSLY
jgi:hypothetical protein